VAARGPVGLPLRVWVLGDAGHEDFRACVEQIVARTEATLFPTWPDELARDSEPDLCVVLAARPGEFAPETIESLRHWAPLARVVGLLGSWCEGESRTGRPWTAVPRVYWHRWQAWFERELAAWENCECGTLSLPLTATEEERLLHGGALSGERGDIAVAVSVAIHSASREMAGMLVEACAALGYDARRYDVGDTSANEQPAIGIYDAATCEAGMIEELRELAAGSPSTYWLVLANFPRPDDERWLREAGATAVLSKPLVIDELCFALTRLHPLVGFPPRIGPEGAEECSRGRKSTVHGPK
jgi:hypothetical protein